MPGTGAQQSITTRKVSMEARDLPGHLRPVPDSGDSTAPALEPTDQAAEDAARPIEETPPQVEEAASPVEDAAKPHEEVPPSGGLTIAGAG